VLIAHRSFVIAASAITPRLAQRNFAAMHFGLHFFMACNQQQSQAQRYRETIEQAVRAEALGFESVWPVEHHFGAVVSALSCPSVLLAAIAARTERLRLGTAIAQLPLHHPMRLAEEFASLDVLSEGRVELGIGRGGNPIHFAGFGVPISESRERFEESYSFLHRAFTQERFDHEGKYYRAQELALVPRPHQPGGPRVHVAANSVETASWAGRHGLPILLATNIHPLPVLPRLLDAYHAGRSAGGHAAAGPEHLSVLMPMFVAESESQARERFAPSVQHHAQLTEMLLSAALRKLTGPAAEALVQLVDHARTIDYDKVDQTMGVVGSVEHCRSQLRDIALTLRPGRIIGWFDFGGLVPHAHVLESMQLFSAALMPEWLHADL
jgi:alkanesulfonate monooxygenase SsuD/methylene tetrahydromethanopterin reductase-like flavin-dependent oxidoreductase (luciferase family)